MSDFVPKPNTANLFYNWTKTAKNGNEYISIKFESNDEYESKRGNAPSSQQQDDDMPF